MYDWPEIRAETDLYWDALRDSFADFGFDRPDELFRGDDETSWWDSSSLFFSQTCGYPFSKFPKGQAALLGTPHFNVGGWSGPYYASAILISKEFSYSDITATKEALFAYNGPNSLSGVKCLTPMIGDALSWFDRTVLSGAHRSSATMVATGDADICAVDAYCWYLFQTFEPELSNALKVLEWSPQQPALPYITTGNVGDEDLENMRIALRRGIDKARLIPELELLKLSGSSVLESDVYTPLSLF